jgi:possible bacteriophage endonuclease
MNLLKEVLKGRDNFEIVVDSGQETVEVDRSQYIGGSDIPIIIGISHFTKASKLAQLKNKVIPYENKKTLYTEFGHIFEPFIRETANKKFNKKFIPCCKTAEDLGLRANCDGWDAENKYLLEVKTNNGEHFDKSDYIAQIHFYMVMYGTQDCILAEYARTKEEEEAVQEALDRNASQEELDLIATNFFDKNRVVFTEIKGDPELAKKIFYYIENFKNIPLDMANRGNNFEILSKIYGKIETEEQLENYNNLIEVADVLDNEYKVKKVMNYYSDRIVEKLNTESIKKNLLNKIENYKDFIKLGKKSLPKFDAEKFMEDYEKNNIKEKKDYYYDEVEIDRKENLSLDNTKYKEYKFRGLNERIDDLEDEIIYTTENLENYEEKAVKKMLELSKEIETEKERAELEIEGLKEKFLEHLHRGKFEELPSITFENFRYVPAKKIIQKRINKKKIEFDYPELFEKYLVVEDKPQEIKLK